LKLEISTGSLEVIEGSSKGGFGGFRFFIMLTLII